MIVRPTFPFTLALLLAVTPAGASFGWQYILLRFSPGGAYGHNTAGETNELVTTRQWDIAFDGGMRSKAHLTRKEMSALAWTNAPSANVDLYSTSTAYGSARGQYLHASGSLEYELVPVTARFRVLVEGVAETAAVQGSTAEVLAETVMSFNSGQVARQRFELAETATFGRRHDFQYELITDVPYTFNTLMEFRWGVEASVAADGDAFDPAAFGARVQLLARWGGVDFFDLDGRKLVVGVDYADPNLGPDDSWLYPHASVIPEPVGAALALVILPVRRRGKWQDR